MENAVHSNKAETNSFQWLSAQSVSILPRTPIATVKNCKRKEAEGHLCNLPQPDMSAVITETLKNLHPAFKSLVRWPLKGRHKSTQDHQTLQVFLKVLSRVVGEGGGLLKWTREKLLHVLVHLKWSAVWTCPCLLFHYGKVTRGPVCWPNTINKVSAAHQYCYLHRVLICSPYNHKMLIAPINSQSVCALVWPPWALKVSVKMNCSLILLQEKIFSQDNTVCSSEIKRPDHPLSFLSFPVSSS